MFNDLSAYFFHRLTDLRSKRGVSAREMSLALGQNPGYINKIENQKSYPSMDNFFYICEYLQIGPREFFEEKTYRTPFMYDLIEKAQDLNEEQISLLLTIADYLKKSNGNIKMN